MTAYQSYIKDVTSGKIPASKWVKLAVKRHVDDLKSGSKRGLTFDPAAADKAIAFFSLLKHYKGKYKGQPFHLLPWQAFFIAMLFGWKKADGTRRFNYSYLKVSRKNGKTTLASGICLYGLIADGESGAEIYTSATTRDQASICFKDATEIINADSNLKSIVEVWKNSLVCGSSSLKPVSSEAGNLDGLNPHIALVDEYHAHKTDEVFNVMKSGMGSRTQPIHLTITTAGFNKTSPCFTYEKTCKEILQGIKTDDAQLVLIYDLDEEDDYLNEKVWIKANPSLGSTPSVEFLRREVQQAKNNPSQLVNLLTKNFNQWTDSSSTWIEFEKWKVNTIPADIDDEFLATLPCYGALDLSSTRDITSYTKTWVGDGVLYCKNSYYLPEDTLQARVKKDRVRYDLWAEEGWIKTTPGNTIDYSYIKNDILEDMERYELEGIAFDRWNSDQLVIWLTGEEVKMYPHGQGFVSMSAPSKKFETMVYQSQIQHDGNPVTAWMLGNIELSTDPSGNIKPDKKRSPEKIDGIVSIIMSIGLIMSTDLDLATEGPSRYEDEKGGLWVI